MKRFSPFLIAGLIAAILLGLTAVIPALIPTLFIGYIIVVMVSGMIYDYTPKYHAYC